mgnify:CR=1 FL=1
MSACSLYFQPQWDSKWNLEIETWNHEIFLVTIMISRCDALCSYLLVSLKIIAPKVKTMIFIGNFLLVLSPISTCVYRYFAYFSNLDISLISGLIVGFTINTFEIMELRNSETTPCLALSPKGVIFLLLICRNYNNYFFHSYIYLFPRNCWHQYMWQCMASVKLSRDNDLRCALGMTRGGVKWALVSHVWRTCMHCSIINLCQLYCHFSARLYLICFKLQVSGLAYSRRDGFMAAWASLDLFKQTPFYVELNIQI